MVIIWLFLAGYNLWGAIDPADSDLTAWNVFGCILCLWLAAQAADEDRPRPA